MDGSQIGTDGLTQGLFLLSVEQAGVGKVFECRYNVSIGEGASALVLFKEKACLTCETLTCLKLVGIQRTALKGLAPLVCWLSPSIRHRYSITLLFCTSDSNELFLLTLSVYGELT